MSYRFYFQVFLVLAFLIRPLNSIAQEDTTDVGLSLESLLDMHVSSASKYEQTLRDAPASVTIITAEDIEHFGYHTLADVLANQRGFYISNDRNYNYAGVRGFGRPTDYNNRLLVLINGTAVNESTFLAAGIGSDLGVDLQSVDRIEIVRGPGSALYGTSAMFAVINIITRNAEGIDLSLETGSFGRKKLALLSGKEFANGFRFMLSGSLVDIDGQDVYVEYYDHPSTNNGRATDLDWERHYEFISTVGYKDFAFQIQSHNVNKGIPTAAWGVIFNDENTWTEDRATRVGLTFDRDLAADKNLFIRGHFNMYSFDGSYPYSDEGERYDSYEEGQSTWGGGEFRFRWDTNPAHRLVLGLDMLHHARVAYLYYDEFDVYTDFNAPFSVISLYAQSEYEALSNLVITLGGRHDYYSSAGHTVSPRIALLYKLSPQGSLKLLYGKAFRTPSAFELNYEEPISGFAQNMNLKPERIRTFEVVWEQEFSPVFSSTFSVFNYRLKDLIDTDINPADSLVHYVNTARVNASGVEAELQYRTPSGLHGFISSTLQRAQDSYTEETLSNSPFHLLKAGIVVPVRPNLFAALRLRHEGARKTIYESETPPFLLADVTLTTRHLFNVVAVSLQVRNLFDTAYSYPGGFEHEQATILQDGRYFIGKIDVSF